MTLTCYTPPGPLTENVRARWDAKPPYQTTTLGHLMVARKTVIEIQETKAALVKEWAETAARIQPDLDRIAAIRAELEELDVAKYSVPGIDLKLDVTQGSSFKPDLFMAAYPITRFPQFYKAVPDQDRIKDGLAPADVDKFRVANKPSVKLV